MGKEFHKKLATIDEDEEFNVTQIERRNAHSVADMSKLEYFKKKEEEKTPNSNITETSWVSKLCCCFKIFSR